MFLLQFQFPPKSCHVEWGEKTGGREDFLPHYDAPLLCIVPWFICYQNNNINQCCLLVYLSSKGFQPHFEPHIRSIFQIPFPIKGNSQIIITRRQGWPATLHNIPLSSQLEGREISTIFEPSDRNNFRFPFQLQANVIMTSPPFSKQLKINKIKLLHNHFCFCCVLSEVPNSLTNLTLND